MSLQQKTTTELADLIVSQLETALGQTLQLLPKSFSRVISKVLAGVFVLLYKYGGFIFLQLFVQYASDTPTTINGNLVTPLTEWGRLVGAGDPVAATRWEGTVTIPATGTPTLPANSLLTNLTTGYSYVTLADAVASGGSATATIRAVSDQDDNGGRGTGGNLEVNDQLSLVNPPAGFGNTGTVASVTTTAADKESTDAYRARVIDRFRKQPQGGAYVDYELWGEETAGIINTYPYTGDPGTVELYSEATPESSGSDDGIPTNAQLLDVKYNVERDNRDLATRRPADSFVYSYAITRNAHDVDILGLSGPNIDTTKTKIEEALTSYFWSREPYIPGLSLGARKDRLSNSAVAGAVQDVANAFDATFTSVSVRLQGGSNYILYSLGKGEKAKSGVVSYI